LIWKYQKKLKDANMEALHLRAQPDTINMIMNMINKVSKSGKEIEILDNVVYDKEQKMIFQALVDEKRSEIFEHDDVWNEYNNNS
jgi:hypothetical protein